MIISEKGNAGLHKQTGEHNFDSYHQKEHGLPIKVKAVIFLFLV